MSELISLHCFLNCFLVAFYCVCADHDGLHQFPVFHSKPMLVKMENSIAQEASVISGPAGRLRHSECVRFHQQNPPAGGAVQHARSATAGKKKLKRTEKVLWIVF